MKSNKIILMHFDSRRELLHAVDILKQYKVLISEIHLPGYSPGLHQEPSPKAFNWKRFILKFGLFGAVIILAFAFYLFQRSNGEQFNKLNYRGPALSLVLSVMLYIFAYLFSFKSPSTRTLPSRDEKFRLAVKFKNKMQQQEAMDLIKPYGSIEMSEDLKCMIID